MYGPSEAVETSDVVITMGCGDARPYHPDVDNYRQSTSSIRPF